MKVKDKIQIGLLVVIIFLLLPQQPLPTGILESTYLEHENASMYLTVPTGAYIQQKTRAIGAYYNNGVVVCKNINGTTGACLHEIGHMADDYAGRPSRNPNFGLALTQYAILNINDRYETGTLSNLIWEQYDILDDDYKIISHRRILEIYATMWEAFMLQYWRMPEEFEPFFNIPHMPYIIEENTND